MDSWLRLLKLGSPCQRQDATHWTLPLTTLLRPASTFIIQLIIASSFLLFPVTSSQMMTHAVQGLRRLIFTEEASQAVIAVGLPSAIPRASALIMPKVFFFFSSLFSASTQLAAQLRAEPGSILSVMAAHPQICTVALAQRDGLIALRGPHEVRQIFPGSCCRIISLLILSFLSSLPLPDRKALDW